MPSRDSRGLNTSNAEKLKTSTQELRFAAKHLVDIDAFLSNLRSEGIDTKKWEAPLDRWTRGLFLYPDGWSSAQSRSFSHADLEMLNMLGDIMSVNFPILSPDGSEKILEFVEQISETLGAEDVNPHLLRHMRNLIGHIRWCLENYDLVGDFEIDNALNQLAATVTLQVSEDEAKLNIKVSPFRKFKDQWVDPFTVGALAGYAGNMLTAATTLALPQ